MSYHPHQSGDHQTNAGVLVKQFMLLKVGEH